MDMHGNGLPPELALGVQLLPEVVVVGKRVRQVFPLLKSHARVYAGPGWGAGVIGATSRGVSPLAVQAGSHVGRVTVALV